MAKLTGDTVVKAQHRGRRVDTGQELQRLHRHHGADDARDWREHAIAGAAPQSLVILGVDAGIARRVRVVGAKHGELALEPNGRTGHQAARPRDTRAIHLEARREVIAAIEHDIGVADRGVEGITMQTFVDCHYLDARIDLAQPLGELEQADRECVAAEREGLRHRAAPPYHLSFQPRTTSPDILDRPSKIPVAILREEGSNGDREMASAFYAAGFEPWDVVMSDLLSGRVDLERFRGVVFVGGFSYADVLDSAKGWAGAIRFSDELRRRFAINGEADDVRAVETREGRYWAGLPERECGFLAELVDKGEVGLELCHDPCVDMIVGVYAIRPVGR